MNKSLNLIIPALVSLIFALMCCHSGASCYDSRLVEADSLLRANNPDSALQVLSAIDGAGLRNAGDRAYHALLLTQAQYRCYADITSDSTINEALDYYRHHTAEQEKLTRSYIYKGAVEEVLNKPEDAMTLYKQAVSVSSKDDNFNLGYAKLRIGCLYRDYLVMDSADILNLKQALHHFEQVPDSYYITQCLSTIGNSYAAIGKNDSAHKYLKRADTLIKALNLTSLDVLNQRYLADLKMFSHETQDIVDAKNIAVSLADKDTDEHNHLLLIAAFTLAKLNKVDSANIYLQQVEKDNLTDGLRVLYNDCYAQLAHCQGDIEQFENHFRRADDITDSLLSNKLQMRLRDVEAKYDNEVLKNKSLTYRNNWIISLMGLALLAAVLGGVTVAMRRKLSWRQRQLREREDTIERLHDDTALLNKQLNAHQTMNAELKQAVLSQVAMFTNLVEQHVTTFANSPKKFSELFERTYTKNGPKDSFWIGIRSYANSKYSGIIMRSLEEYPSLTDTDLNFLSLYCCGFPTLVIMACMGYKEAHSVYNKKRRVAEALGFSNSLDAYIKLFT